MHGTLLWAAVGDGLLLGSGAALPLWPTRYVIRSSPAVTGTEGERDSLWAAVRCRL